MELGLRDRVFFEPTSKVLNFGNGERLAANTKATVPAHLFGHELNIEVYIVPGSAPLLVSRPGMEAWGVSLDLRGKRTFV